MQNETLSASEQKVFDAIVDFITDTKYPPTIRELRDLTGYNSTATIHNKLRKLKEKGLIDFAVNGKRTIRIVTPTEDVVPVVRCSQCRKRYTTECALWFSQLDDNQYFCGAIHNDDFYCSYGERE